mgnify:CR=1 FL=1
MKANSLKIGGEVKLAPKLRKGLPYSSKAGRAGTVMAIVVRDKYSIKFEDGKVHTVDIAHIVMPTIAPVPPEPKVVSDLSPLPDNYGPPRKVGGVTPSSPSRQYRP